MKAELAAAVLIGLTSSAHCAFMCGGIAASLSAEHSNNGTTSKWVLNGLFHLGRLLSYALIGLLIGTLVSSVSSIVDLGIWLRIVAGLLLICMGLYLANIWRGLSYFERLMEPMWRPISAFLRKRHMPVRTPGNALVIGLFWGWLPCGLVYSTLAWASTSNTPYEAAILMFAMGVGSLPVLLGISVFGQLLRQRWTTVMGGVALCVFGLWTLAMPLMSLTSDGHSSHSNHQQSHQH